ncbi:di-trans,poly-cis-decaprenylcistransferase [Rhodococcus hoagii]|nr:di-trans,poly-cis-decaprenylcistransferase [Prescottella equi]
MIRRREPRAQPDREIRPPFPHPWVPAHPSAARVDPQPRGARHGRQRQWAQDRGLPRTAGHERGEDVLMDTVAGCIEIGVKWLSAYAFSTENWKRSPEEVKFLMGFNRDVIRRRRDEMHEMGVRVRWGGADLGCGAASSGTRDRGGTHQGNTVMTLTMGVNYGGRAEIADAAREIARRAAAGEIDPEKISEATFAKYLDEPDMPDVDLFLRPSGEQRTSNFLIWQAAYAELVFQENVSGLRPPRPLGCVRRVCVPRSSLRGSEVPVSAPDAAEALQERARAALAGFVAVESDDDGSLRFEYGGALCSLRAVTLADGLDVLSLTGVLAWDGRTPRRCSSGSPSVTRRRSSDRSA